MKRLLTGRSLLMGAAAGAFVIAGNAFAQNDGGGVSPQAETLTTIYRETYGYCTGSIGRDAAIETDWWAFRSGSPVGKFSNLKVFSYGSRSIDGSVQSNPKGLSQGYSFWFRPTYGLTVFTREFSFPASVLSDPSTVVEYEQRLSGVDVSGVTDRSQLAFLIDNNWYISDESVGQTSFAAWESVSLRPSTLSWGTTPALGQIGPDIPLSYNKSLPASGTVQAFGAFVTEVRGRVRFENFVIKTANPPGGADLYPELSPVVESCPPLSPDHTGGPGPTPTPNPDDDDGTPDDGGGSPGEGGGPPSVNYVLCPVTEQGSGKTVALSAASGAKVIKKITQNTDVDRRDRALLSILAGRKLKAGALVNVMMSDYSPQKGTLAVKKRKTGAATVVRLRASTRAALNSYLSQLELISSRAPLFPKSNGRTKQVTATSAACLKELQAMIKSRARAAKLPSSPLLK